MRFTLKDDHTLAEETRERTQCRITLTLNEDGERRYQIDGKEKEYLRWQVLRKTLKEPLFARANRQASSLRYIISFIINPLRRLHKNASG